MTKLTDLQGAEEAFVVNVYQTDVYNVHLEVDVEAMAKEIKIGITDVDDFEKLMANGKVRKLFMECATHLSTTTPKWARLVRK